MQLDVADATHTGCQQNHYIRYTLWLCDRTPKQASHPWLLGNPRPIRGLINAVRNAAWQYALGRI